MFGYNTLDQEERTMRKILSTCIWIAILVSACGPVTKVAEPSTPSWDLDISSLEVISPENVGQLEEIGSFGRGKISDLAISPDERIIAVSTTTGIYFYDGETFEETVFENNAYPSMFDAYFQGRAIAFSPDGSLFVVEDETDPDFTYEQFMASITVWDYRAHKPKIQIFIGMQGFQINRIAFSPDGEEIIVSMTYYDYGDVIVSFDVASGKRIFHVPGGTFQVVGNQTVYVFRKTLNDFVEALILDEKTGEVLKVVHYDSKNGGSVYDISPDGGVIAIYDDSDRTTALVDAKTQNVLEKVDGLVLFLINQMFIRW
jgi:WD40 repeat protein